MNRASASNWLHAFASGDFSGLPPIMVLPPDRMPGLWGGYSREKNRIYLSSECPKEAIPAVILEEVGHFLDSELCPSETLGEEGAIFASIVLRHQPAGSELEAWRTDEGWAWITDNNGPVLVEGARQKNKNKSGGGGSKSQQKSKSQSFSSKKKKSKTITPDSGGAADSGGASDSGGSAGPTYSPPVPPVDSWDDTTITQSYSGQTLLGNANDNTFNVKFSSVFISDSLGGSDTVETALDAFSLENFSEIEHLVLTRAVNARLTGNILSNSISGNDGNNTIAGLSGSDTILAGDGEDSLDGGDGIDSLIGGSGNDTYVLDSIDDTILEFNGEGTDLVEASMDYTLGANVENLALTGTAVSGTGNSLNNTLTGNASNNILDSGAGIDTLVGGRGNDTYFVDTTTDKIVDDGADSADLVVSSVSFDLSNTLVGGGNTIENLFLTGTAVSATGNSLNNTLTGNSSGNILDGGAGIDTLIGGQGNDTYFVDDASEMIVEVSREGTDIVVASVTGYALANHVENLVLTGTAVSGTGNSLNNTLTGNSVGNRLDGGAGIDTLIGGRGNDTYSVDSTTDSIVEDGADSADLVVSSVSFDLSNTLVGG
ncbi:MAG: calcium-binding protein, partial [Verrucomicrobia bacterium]|nr:calcium-binding protein [Verrucomicrobiota bacterium]